MFWKFDCLEGRGREAWKREKKKLGKEKKAEGLCPVAEKCGGCQMLDMEYEKQLKLKKKRLEELLEGICPVKGMIGMENPFHYRNKVTCGI